MYYYFSYTKNAWEDIPINCHMTSEEHLVDYLNRCCSKNSEPFGDAFVKFSNRNDAMNSFSTFKLAHPTITRHGMVKCAFCSLEYVEEIDGEENYISIDRYAQPIDT